MKAILRDFFRYNLSMLIRAAVITAVCVACLAITGMYTRNDIRIAAIAVTVFLGLAFLWLLAQVFIAAPARFGKRLEKLTEEERTEVLGAYDKSIEFGNKRIFNGADMFIFFYKMNIYPVRFGDIAKIDIDLRAGGVRATLKDESELFIPADKQESLDLFWKMIQLKNSDVEATFEGKSGKEAREEINKRYQTEDN